MEYAGPDVLLFPEGYKEKVCFFWYQNRNSNFATRICAKLLEVHNKTAAGILSFQEPVLQRYIHSCDML